MRKIALIIGLVMAIVFSGVIFASEDVVKTEVIENNEEDIYIENEVNEVNSNDALNDDESPSEEEENDKGDNDGDVINSNGAINDDESSSDEKENEKTDNKENVSQEEILVDKEVKTEFDEIDKDINFRTEDNIKDGPTVNVSKEDLNVAEDGVVVGSNKVISEIEELDYQNGLSMRAVSKELSDDELVETSSDDFKWYSDSEGVTINSYEGTDDVVIVPKEIDGKSVIRIGNNAFSSKECTEIYLPETIIEIGEFCFYECKKLKKINIPRGLLVINRVAFKGCESLESIVIPDNIVSIEEYAFAQSGLINITIPDSVKNIKNKAFYQCKSLEEVILSKNITSIEESTFYMCEKLKKINLPNTLEEINKNAFSFCGIEEIIIPENVERIGEQAFMGCELLSSINIPNSVNELSNHIFANCTSLNNIELHEGISSIGEYSFQYSGITSISIPEGIRIIPRMAFFGCKSLKSVSIPNSVEVIGDCAFRDCYKLENIVIPDGVVTLGLLSFSKSGLRNIEIPSNVKSIGDSAFAYCGNLQSVVVTEGELVGAAFYACRSLKDVEFKSETCPIIGRNSFAEIHKDAEAVYPENNSEYTNDKYPFRVGDPFEISGPSNEAKVIDSSYEIDGKNIKKVHSYNKESFEVSIEISESATWKLYSEIECSNEISKTMNLKVGKNLAYVKVTAEDGKTTEIYTLIIERLSKYGYPVTESSKFEVRPSVEDLIITKFTGMDDRIVVVPEFINGKKIIGIDRYVFAGHTNHNIPTGISCEEIYLPDSIKQIGENQFYRASSLNKVRLSENIESIPNSTFNYCGNLIEINIPEKVKSIGEYAFVNCIKLNNVTLPSSLISIDDGAFQSCTSMTEITIPNTVNSIGESAFQGCSNLKSVNLSSALEEIPQNAFRWCRKISEVSLPSSLTVIKQGAFDETNGLKKVVFNSMVAPTIEIDAFKTIASNAIAIVPNGSTGYDEGQYPFIDGIPLKLIKISNEANLLETDGYSIDEMLVSKVVMGSVNTLTVDVNVSKYAQWELYSDEACTLKIADKIMSLEVGENKAYIKVVASDNVAEKKYSLIVERSPFSWITEGDTATITGYYGSEIEITVPENMAGKVVDKIGSAVFKNKISVTSVELPDTIKEIGLEAFMACENLVSIDLPQNLEKIGAKSFEGNIKLSALSIPTNVSNIGEEAFSNCRNLASISFKGDICPIIGVNSFNGIAAESKAYIPESGSGYSEESYPFIDGNPLKMMRLSSSTNIESMVSPSDVIFDGKIIKKEVEYETTRISVDLKVEGNGTWKLYEDKECTKEITDKTVSLKLGESTYYIKTISSDKKYSDIFTLNLLRKYKEVDGFEYFLGDGGEKIIVNYLNDVSIMKVPSQIDGSNKVIVAYRAFKGNKELEHIEFEGNFIGIDVGGFEGCENLESVIFRGDKAPMIIDKAFDNIKEGAKAYIREDATGFDSSKYPFVDGKPLELVIMSDKSDFVDGKGFSIKDSKISKTVENNISETIVDIDVDENGSWKLYKDPECTVEINNKKLPLVVGNNTVYVKITASDWKTEKVYPVNIVRKNKIVVNNNKKDKKKHNNNNTSSLSNTSKAKTAKKTTHFDEKKIKTVDDKKLDEAIVKTGEARIELKKNEEKLILSEDTMGSLFKEEETLLVKKDEFSIVLSDESLHLGDKLDTKNNNISITTKVEKKNSEEEADKLYKKGLFRLNNDTVILDISEDAGGKSTEEKHIEKFDKLVDVTVDLDEFDLNDYQMKHLTGLRYEIDESGEEVPVKLGGVVDEEFNTFTFKTDKPGEFTVATSRDIFTVEMEVEKHIGKVNGEKKDTYIEPKKVDENIMIPIRFVGEALGAEVTWNQEDWTVGVHGDGIDVDFDVRENLDGYEEKALLSNSRTLVPVEMIEREFGVSVVMTDGNNIMIVK
ncbi:MAG: leucine-rich repeat protein [Firmicutes bacterium]|nr:leucine-rich repeat protein [Bacillota bacterium]